MPNSIKYFEWFFLSSLVIGVIGSALSYKKLVAQTDPLFVDFVQFFVLSALLVLILLASRKRSKIAKWSLVVLFGVGLVFYIPQLPVFFELGFFAGVLSSIQLVIQCIAIYFLFTEEGRVWFKDKDKTEPMSSC